MSATIRVAGIAAMVGVFGCDGATELSSEPQEPAPRPVVLGIIAGNNQTGAAGDPVPERLVVRVTDSAGIGVAGQRVTWTVTSGGGSLYDYIGADRVAVDAAFTKSDGSAAVNFTPAKLGISTITAAVSGRTVEPVTFSIDATMLVISNAFWGYFLSPDGSLDASVPVGTPVEWVNAAMLTVEIETTAVPAGVTAFRVRLGSDERYRLVPEVAGTWQWTFRYVDDAGAVVWDGEETRLLVAQPAA